MAVVDETELLRAVRENGSWDAYSVLWERHRNAALTQARRLANADAEDIVSEAFTQVWQQLRDGRGPDSHFRAYVLTVVRNIAARWHERGRLVVTGTEVEAEVDFGFGPAELVESVDDRRRVLVAFESLPERWREVLWLNGVERLPRAKIAKRLGLSPNATTVLMRRAKEGLRLAWLRQHLPGEAEVEHPDIVEMMPRYIRGSLGRQRRLAMDVHLEGCEECRAYLFELRAAAPDTGRSSRLLDARIDAAVAAAGLFSAPILALSILGTQGSGISHAAATPHHLTGLSNNAALSKSTVLSKATLAVVAGASVCAAALVVALALTVPTVPEDDGQTPVASSDSSHAGEQDRPSPGVPPPGSDPALEDESAAEMSPGAEKVGGGGSLDGTGTGVAAAFTVSATNANGGAFAPKLSGTSEPGTRVDISVAELRYSVRVADDGRWSSDLASLELPVGEYTVTATPRVAGSSPRTVRFSLFAPTASLIGAQGNLTRIVVHGIAGAEVCVTLGAGLYQRFELGSDGSAKGIVPASATSGGTVTLAYCDGSRFGASGQSG